MVHSQKQMEIIPELSFMDALEYTTKDNKDAIITVGIIKDGKAAITAISVFVRMRRPPL